MRKRDHVLPEYSTVRVVKLRHDDRWSEEGAPSVGDQGTVVHFDESEDDVWYTVERTDGTRTLWIAEFSHDELALVAGPGVAHDGTATKSILEESAPQQTADRDVSAARSADRNGRASEKPTERRPRSERARRDGTDEKIPLETKGTDSARQALVVLASCLLGGVSAVAVVHVLLPAGPWTVALVVGAGFGLVGALAAGTLVEAAVVVVLLSALTALLLAISTHPLILTAVVSFSSGAGVGQLTASIYNDFIAPSS